MCLTNWKKQNIILKIDRNLEITLLLILGF